MDLPDHSQSQLHLPGIADAALHGAVEVEDEACHFGAAQVLAVEEIEDVEGWLDGCPGVLDRPGQPHVERRELIVLASQVSPRHRAVGVDAILRRLRGGHESRIAETILAAERVAYDA